MTDDEIMKQALDALEEINKLSIGENAICLPAEIDTAMDALRERLAQPEQKPVSGVVLDEHGSAALVKNGSEDWHCKKHNARRLYTTPPQRKPEQEPVVKWDASAPLVVHPHPAFQAAPLQRKPEQELVIDCPRCGHCCPPQGIYYTPPQRTWVGLTDEEIKMLPQWFPSHESAAVTHLIRAFEAKLREKNT